MKALKKLEYEAIKQLRVNYFVELHALDMKYQELFVPLDQQVESFTLRKIDKITTATVSLNDLWLFFCPVMAPWL